MTSQIAIMNYDGVAIASDTITSLKSSRGTKTIGNASKIWDIGPKHSVVVLHSGSTVINSISHRMHFTEWAKSLEAPLPTLKQYVDSYYAFCSHAHHLISFDDEKKFAENCIQSMLANIKDYIDQALPHWNAERETWTSVGEDEFEIARNRYTEFIAMYEKVGEFPKFNDDQARKLITNYNFDLDSIIEEIFLEYPIDEELRKAIKETCFLALSRRDTSVCLTSQLAFVGYGSNEPYAGNIRCDYRGIYGGHMQCTEEDYKALSPDVSSRIATFGQDEAIWGFVRGVRWSVLEFIDKRIKEWLSEESGLPSEQISKLTENLEEIVSRDSNRWIFNNFTSPLLSSIEGMSAIGLGELAESLVGIQSTSTYAEEGTATVGGTIEVATIDRRNGVVWRKRIDNSNNQTSI